MNRLEAVTLDLISAANLQSRQQVNICTGWYILFSFSFLLVKLSEADVFVRDVPVLRSASVLEQAALKPVWDIIMENLKVVISFSRNNWYEPFQKAWYCYLCSVVLGFLLVAQICIYTTWKVHFTTFLVNSSIPWVSCIYFYNCFKIHRLLLKHRNYGSVMDSSLI